MLVDSGHDSLRREMTGEALPSGDGVVAVLGDILVGLLGGVGGGALDGLGDVVGGLLSGVHDDGLVVFESVLKFRVVCFCLPSRWLECSSVCDGERRKVTNS